MSVTHVTVTIRNPADPARSWRGPFLVDTGAMNSLVPRPHLDAIGLTPKAQRMHETADGREVAIDVTTGEIEVMGELTAGLIIFGDADAEPRLGVTALESAGIEVDPQNGRLRKLPAVRLKVVVPGNLAVGPPAAAEEARGCGSPTASGTRSSPLARLKELR